MADSRRAVVMWRILLAVLSLCLLSANPVSAEFVFQDFFTQPAGNITNSVPWIDVEGKGWQSAAVPSHLALDGNGHVYNAAASAGAAASIQLVPIGPHGTMTASATVQIPADSAEWIGLGFGASNQFLTASASGSGPWVQVSGTGAVTLYDGARLNHPANAPNGFPNTGSPAQIILAYDAFNATASVGIVAAGTTNQLFSQWPLTNTAGSVTPRYLIFQFSTNLATATSRWASAATVDWIPRPPPLLTLPGPIAQTFPTSSCRSSPWITTRSRSPKES